LLLSRPVAVVFDEALHISVWWTRAVGRNVACADNLRESVVIGFLWFAQQSHQLYPHLKKDSRNLEIQKQFTERWKGNAKVLWDFLARSWLQFRCHCVEASRRSLPIVLLKSSVVNVGKAVAVRSTQAYN